MDCLWQVVKRHADVHVDELIWKPINVLKIYYVSPEGTFTFPSLSIGQRINTESYYKNVFNFKWFTFMSLHKLCLYQMKQMTTTVPDMHTVFIFKKTYLMQLISADARRIIFIP